MGGGTVGYIWEIEREAIYTLTWLNLNATAVALDCTQSLNKAVIRHGICGGSRRGGLRDII